MNRTLVIVLLAAGLIACDQDQPADMTATPPNPPQPDIPMIHDPAPPAATPPQPAASTQVERGIEADALPSHITDAVIRIYRRAVIESFTSSTFEDGTALYEVTFNLPDRSRWTLRLNEKGETIGNARCIEQPH
jgi:hypothetical protein